MAKKGTVKKNAPDCIVEANTRDEALEKARESIAEIISRSEIFHLDVSAVPKSRSLHFEGIWGQAGFRFIDELGNFGKSY